MFIFELLKRAQNISVNKLSHTDYYFKKNSNTCRIFSSAWPLCLSIIHTACSRLRFTLEVTIWTHVKLLMANGCQALHRVGVSRSAEGYTLWGWEGRGCRDHIWWVSCRTGLIKDVESCHVDVELSKTTNWTGNGKFYYLTRTRSCCSTMHDCTSCNKIISNI